MQISEHKVVTLNYEVVDDQGQLIDRSEEGGPLAYIHGTGQLIPGLETALADRGQGDKISVDVPPEQGYGERDEEGVQTVSRDQFDDDDEIEVGMQFEAQDDEGHQIVTVVAVDERVSPSIPTTRSPARICTSMSRCSKCATPRPRNSSMVTCTAPVATSTKHSIDLYAQQAAPEKPERPVVRIAKKTTSPHRLFT